MNSHSREIKKFIALCIKAKNSKTIYSLFNLFFTHEELENLALRFSIIYELIKDQKTQREIAKNLNVSIAKITRGSNELKRINKKLFNDLKQHLQLKN